MSWQKCPICDGTGQMSGGNYSSSVFVTCPVCRGYRIISDITGLPPEYEIQKRIEEMNEFDKRAEEIFKREI